jgi:hypothetical protein
MKSLLVILWLLIIPCRPTLIGVAALCGQNEDFLWTGIYCFYCYIPTLYKPHFNKVKLKLCAHKTLKYRFQSSAIRNSCSTKGRGLCAAQLLFYRVITFKIWLQHLLYFLTFHTEQNIVTFNGAPIS